MKNIKINLCLFLVVSLSISGHESNTVQKFPEDTIKDNKKFETNTSKTEIKKIDDYKKAADSILMVTDNVNIKNEKDLKEIKQINKEYQLEDQKIESTKKELVSNINKLISKLKKNKENDSKFVAKSNPDNKSKNEVYIKNVDSVFVKGNLFRKARYDYILIFSNGTQKKIKNN